MLKKYLFQKSQNWVFSLKRYGWNQENQANKKSINLQVIWYLVLLSISYRLCYLWKKAKLTVSLPGKNVVSVFFPGVIQEDECKWKIQEGEWGVMLIIMKSVNVTAKPKTCCYLCTSGCNFWADSTINCNSPALFLGDCTMKNTAFPSSTHTKLHWYYYSTGIHSLQCLNSLFQVKRFF